MRTSELSLIPLFRQDKLGDVYLPVPLILALKGTSPAFWYDRITNNQFRKTTPPCGRSQHAMVEKGGHQNYHIFLMTPYEQKYK